MWRAVHIGGTNGKGSVAAMVAAALRAGGWRVGLYTSPHLVSVRERMLVDGTAMSEDAFAAWTARLRPVIEDANASFFEATTAIAFADFAARGVDIGVVEVGLGGRLDSTNVLVPLVSAVTTIAREHSEYLGSDLGDIAREKAGIAKLGVPFLTGEPDPRVRAVLVGEAEQRGALVASPDLEAWSRSPWVRPGLVGVHQRRNAALAAAVCEALPEPFAPGPEAVALGIATARLPGRFDRRGRYVFDVAHNPHAISALVATLDAEALPAPIHAVVGILADKAWAEMLDRLAPHVDALWLTEVPGAPTERQWDLDEVGRWASVTAVRGGQPAAVEPQFRQALDAAASGAATVLVTGSFYTVGAALAALPGFSPIG